MWFLQNFNNLKLIKIKIKIKNVAFVSTKKEQKKKFFYFRLFVFISRNFVVHIRVKTLQMFLLSLTENCTKSAYIFLFLLIFRQKSLFDSVLN